MISDADLDYIRRASEKCSRDGRLNDLGLLLEAIVRTGELLADGEAVNRHAATAVITRATRVSRSLLRSRPTDDTKDPQ